MSQMRVDDLTQEEQDRLINSIIEGYNSHAELDTTHLRVVRESTLIERLLKKGFDQEIVKEVIREICIVEDGVILGLKG